MVKLSELVANLVAECDKQVAEANKAIGGKDECSEDQIANIVASVCGRRDHQVDAVIREVVRETMKAKGYVYKPEKAAK